jgi:hypothetical protein
MNKMLANMRSVAHAAKEIRKTLKLHEEANKKLRESITPIWDNPEKDGIVADLSKQLTVGRANVRACQTALHELKKSFRNYNKRYDRTCMRHHAS